MKKTAGGVGHGVKATAGGIGHGVKAAAGGMGHRVMETVDGVKVAGGRLKHRVDRIVHDRSREAASGVGKAFQRPMEARGAIRQRGGS